MWRRDSMTFAPAVDCWEPRPPFWVVRGRRRQDGRARRAALPARGRTARPATSGAGRTGSAAAPAHPPGCGTRWLGVSARQPGAPERYGLQATCALCGVARGRLAATEQAGAIGAWLLGREAWDLFVVVLGARHWPATICGTAARSTQPSRRPASGSSRDRPRRHLCRDRRKRSDASSAPLPPAHAAWHSRPSA